MSITRASSTASAEQFAASGLARDVQAILEPAVEHAARLCKADDAQAWLVAGDRLAPLAARDTIPIDDASAPGRAVLERRPVHGSFGAWTELAVPVLGEGGPLGALAVRRSSARPFAAHEIELLEVLANAAAASLEARRLRDELDEALQQRAAIDEVLRVMGGSDFDLQTAFETILERGCQLCDAASGTVYRFDGQFARPAAMRGGTLDLQRTVERNLIRPDRRTVAGRVALERRTVHVPDALADPEYAYPAQRVAGYRTLLGVPIQRGELLLACIVIWRTEVRPFGERQIQILETFATQAGIALENLRLLEEVRSRTRELGTALAEKTATAEILSLTATSPTDVQAVLDAVTERAARLGGASYADIRRFENGRLRKISLYGGPGAPDEARELDPPGQGAPTRGTAAGRALLERRTLHVHDMQAAILTEYPLSRDLQRRWGYRTNLAIPLLHEGTPLGVLGLLRFEVRPFSDQEIQLLETFARAAAIALSGAQLFRDLEERTSELARSVQELEALGEVGRAVSSSLDLQEVLTTVVAHATLLSGTDAGVIYEYDEAAREFRLAASVHCESELVDALRNAPLQLGEGAMGRAAVDRRPVQVADVLQASAFSDRLRAVLGIVGLRAVLAVPFMSHDAILGGLVVARQAPGAFSERVVESLQTFATQSALAVRNARLFEETQGQRRDLEQLYRLGTAMQAPISLPERLQLILHAVRDVLGLERAVVWLPTPDDAFLEATAWIGLQPGEGDVIRVPLDGAVPLLSKAYREQAEIILDGSVPVPEPYRLGAGFEHLPLVRSRDPAVIPLISRGRSVGVLAADHARRHRSVASNLELLRTLAASAAVAIENAQLLDKAQQANDAKSAFLANMSHELRTPLNAILGYGEMLQDEAEEAGLDELIPDIQNIHGAGTHLLGLINDILDLSKIEAGKTELYLELIDVSALIREVAAVAQPLVSKNRNTLEVSYRGRPRHMRADLTKLRQVLLNLLSNAAKFTHDGTITLTARLRRQPAGRSWMFEVRDTGIGMTPDQLVGVFEAFNQADASTSRTYGGTGLGLAISRRFCQLMGGDINVHSAPGRGSVFTVTLPLIADQGGAWHTGRGGTPDG